MPKSCCPQAPHWTSVFIFVTLGFLSFLASQTVVQTKGPFITAFLTAGHYLIKTSGSHIVCWSYLKFSMAGGEMGKLTTLEGWGWGELGWAAARADSQVIYCGMTSLRALTLDIGASVGKGRQDVSSPRHLLGGGGGGGVWRTSSTKLSRVLTSPDQPPIFFRIRN